ncbi:MAG: hypothetical protein K6F82_06520 [Sphaerochaetaceae bacterium]|nr:hypothetical protein [Sphaerochaetaceae bacterium]
MDKKLLDACMAECDKLFSSEKDLGFKGSSALVFDLLSGESSVFEIPSSWFNSYISGPALAARLWAHFAQQGADEKELFEQHNPVVITGGAIAGKGVPCADITCFAYRSPQDGRISINSVSSFFGARLLRRGYSALVIKNRARRQSVLHITSDGVSLETTERYSMMSVSETEKALSLSSDCSSVVIGPAGEKNIVYATAVSDRKFCGRGGLGYVLGIKNLKAIVANASVTEKKNTEAFSELCAIAENKNITTLMGSCGSSYFIRGANNAGWAPVNNFSLRTDPRLFYLSSDELTRTLGNTEEIPPYYAVLMLGSNCGCFDPKTVAERCNKVLELGFDPVSLGNILGWAMEAQKRGVILFSKDMDFSDNADVFSIISQIIYGTGFGFHARNGLEEVSRFYEATDYAYHHEGLESGPADVRGSYFQALTQARRTWFTPYPAFFPQLSKADTAAMFELFESLGMGLECFGFSSYLICCHLMNAKDMKLRSALSDSHLARNLLSAEAEAAVLCSLSSAEGSENCVAVKAMNMKGRKKKLFLLKASIKGLPTGPVTEEDIYAAGSRCRALIDSINTVLGHNSMNIPDYFKTDPKSNFRTDSVVPFFALCQEYEHKKALSEAVSFQSH